MAESSSISLHAWSKDISINLAVVCQLLKHSLLVIFANFGWVSFKSFPNYMKFGEASSTETCKVGLCNVIQCKSFLYSSCSPNTNKWDW